MGRVGQVSREIVLVAAQLLRKGAVPCSAPPWEIFPFVIVVGDAQGSFQTGHWEEQNPDQNAWEEEMLLRDICLCVGIRALL